MKKGAILPILQAFFAFSFFSEVGAQNPYSFLLDSTYISKWDNNKQDWILSQTDRYNYIYNGTGYRVVELDQYDNTGNLIRTESRYYTDSTMVRILKNPYNETWVNWRKYFTLYDNLNKEIYSETYVWKNNDWERADKYIWKYDGNYLVQLIRQYIYNGIFQDVLQIDYLYDQDMHLTEYLISNIITQTPVSRILYTYNSLNQRKEGLQQNWVNNNWNITGKILYNYNPCGNLSHIINQTYLNGVFSNASQTEYFYSPHFLGSDAEKVAVCHNGNTINVSKNAIPAHLSHGDCLGECKVEKTTERQDFDDNEKSEPPFTIYPNPASEKITIKFNKDEFNGSKRVELTDFYGKLIRSFNIKDDSDLTIYRDNLLSGKYYVRLVGKEVYSAVVIFE